MYVFSKFHIVIFCVRIYIHTYSWYSPGEARHAVRCGIHELVVTGDRNSLARAQRDGPSLAAHIQVLETQREK